MDKQTARYLNSLTQAFYEAQTVSFSETRYDVWSGQRRVGEMLANAAERMLSSADASTFSVLDIGLGNARFQKMLVADFPDIPWQFFGVDSNRQLSQDASLEIPVQFQQLDIVTALLDGTLAQSFEAPACDACVSFGVMHHVPTDAARKQLLQAMLAHTKPGGMAAVSFWRFMDNPQLAQKSQVAHQKALARLGIDRAALDEGDYLLGWQESDAVRYCHSFSHQEIEHFVELFSSLTSDATTFDSDGRTSDLNTYLVLQRPPL